MQQPVGPQNVLLVLIFYLFIYFLDFTADFITYDKKQSTALEKHVQV